MGSYEKHFFLWRGGGGGGGEEGNRLIAEAKGFLVYGPNESFVKKTNVAQ